MRGWLAKDAHRRLGRRREQSMRSWAQSERSTAELGIDECPATKREASSTASCQWRLIAFRNSLSYPRLELFQVPLEVHSSRAPNDLMRASEGAPLS